MPAIPWRRVPCHGETFKGNGPAAIALNPKPADWTSPRVQDQSDGELFWKISTGRGAMPSCEAFQAIGAELDPIFKAIVDRALARR